MEKNEYRKNALDMIWLTSCALRGTSHDQDRLYEIDLKALFSVCQEHILTACAAYALESAGIKDSNFTQAKEKAIRKLHSCITTAAVPRVMRGSSHG